MILPSYTGITIHAHLFTHIIMQDYMMNTFTSNNKTNSQHMNICQLLVVLSVFTFTLGLTLASSKYQSAALLL